MLLGHTSVLKLSETILVSALLSRRPSFRAGVGVSDLTMPSLCVFQMYLLNEFQSTR